MLKLPGEFGFRRCVVERKEGKGLSVYYYPPNGGKRLRSLKEVREYFSTCKEEKREKKQVMALSSENFSFENKFLNIGEFETYRKAGVKQN